jgi:hypothetical protein
VLSHQPEETVSTVRNTFEAPAQHLINFVQVFRFRRHELIDSDLDELPENEWTF